MSPFIVPGWQAPRFTAPPTGGVLISLGFEPAGSATASLAIPPLIGSIEVSITGANLTAPKQQLWHNNGASQQVTLEIDNLAVGKYSVALALYDSANEVIGNGFSSFTITGAGSQQIQVVMIYTWGGIATQLNFDVASPSEVTF